MGQSSMPPADYVIGLATGGYILKTLSYDRHKQLNKSPDDGNARKTV
jgi:hypothetical protein